RNQNSGTLDIDTDTEYASGTLANSGNIFIASGASLTIQSGATLVLDSGTDLSDNTVNSNGVLVIANGGTLAVKAPVTIDEGAQIYMGDYASGGTPALLHQDASYSGGSGSVPLQLRGELGLDRALVDLKIEVQSPGLIEILNSNQVTFTKDLVITIGGEFDIYGSSAAAGVTFNSAQLNNSGGSVTFMASGGNTVTYTGTGGSVSNSGSMILGVSGGTVNFNSTGTVTNTQGGEFRTQGGGTINMSVATFNNSSSGSGGSIQINTDTGFTGTLNNSKNIYVGTGSKFTITSGSTLANNSSSAEYQSFGSGGGILFIDTGATFSTSSNLTIGGGLTVDLGVASSGGAATWNSGGNTVLVEGRVNMNHVEATVALDVQSGGKVYFTNSNDISYVYLNSQVSGGGQLHVDALTSNSRGTFAGANLTNIGTITLNANSGFEASLFLTNGGSGGFLDNTSGAVIQTMGAGTARIRAEDQVWIENGSSFNVFTNTSVVGGPLINLGGTITVSDDTNNGMSTTLTLDSFQDKAGLVNLSSSGGNTDIPRIAVTSAALLGGVLALNADVFTTATTGSISNVITWGSGQRTGMFDDIQGLVLGTNMGDHVLDPIFTSTGLNFDVLTVGNNTPSSGNDVLIGTGGADMINGGAGDDFIYGGLGDDVLIAGGGSNRLIGGGGLDTADYSGTDVITANLANGSVTGAAAADTLIGVENLIGSSNGDDITGDHHVNDLKGGGGADIIRGGAGNDLLYGEADGDMLFGENGDDKLIGGAGVDTMTGGMGNDQFILNAPADGSDIYVDFTSGEDTIILLEGAPMIFDLAMSSGPIQDGVNFSIISVAFDGTNGEAGGATNTNFANADPTLVYSTFDNTLYYDDDGVGSGFTVLAQLQTGTVAATDIQFYTFGSVVV
ncbi:MAG: hypothetical protein K2P94_16250, partial [Rhodospirillaceae bacterium]|nr:hypothetical protein [Rhodospirillaceae bacterium]